MPIEAERLEVEVRANTARAKAELAAFDATGKRTGDTFQKSGNQINKAGRQIDSTSKRVGSAMRDMNARARQTQQALAGTAKGLDGVDVSAKATARSLAGVSTEARKVEGDLDAAGDGIEKVSRKARAGQKDLDRYSGRLRIVAESLAILGPAAIPIAGLAVPAVTSLAAGLGAAAIGGGVLIGSMQGVGDALKAVNDYALDPTEANLEDMRQAMKGLSPEARKFVRELHGWGPALKSIRDAGAEEILPRFTKGLDALKGRVPEARGIFRSIGREVGRVGEETGKSFASSRWTPFLRFLKGELPGTIDTLATSTGNLAHSAANLWIAFTPLNNDALEWLEEATTRLDEFSDRARRGESEGFNEFTRYLEQNGPQAVATLKAIGNMFVQVIQAAAPLSGPVLRGLEDVANIVADIADSPMGPTIMGGVVALSTFNRTLAVTKALGGSAIGGVVTNLRDTEVRAKGATAVLGGLGGAARSAAGMGGIMLVADSANRSSKALGVLEGAAGGALTGAALGAFAGPPGAAIGAAIGGLGGGLLALGTSAKKSGEDAAVAKPSWDNLRATLDELTGASTGATRALVMDNLVRTGAMKVLNQYGVGTRAAVRAITEGGPARQKFIADMRSQAHALDVSTQAEKRRADAAKARVAYMEQKAGATPTRGNLEAIKAAQREAEAAQRVYEATRKANGEKRRGIGVALDAVGATLREADAQRKNAAATREFSSRIKSLPKAVRTDIRANGLEFTRKAIVDLAAKYRLTPKHVRTLIQENGGRPTKAMIQGIIADAKRLGSQHPRPTVSLRDYASRQISAIRSMLANLNGSEAVTYTTNVVRRRQGATIAAQADGGTVMGQRQPYGDKVLTYLAPGEEVITNRHGEADRYRRDRDAGRIPAYADGGTVGTLVQALKRGGRVRSVPAGASGNLAEWMTARNVGGIDQVLRQVVSRLSGTAERQWVTRLNGIRKVMVEANGLTAKIAAQTAVRDSLVEAKNSMREAVTAGISAQANVLNSGNSASAIRGSLETQVAKVKEFAANLQRMRSMGYSNGVIEQVASAGIEGGNEIAKALAAGSADDVKGISSAFDSINAEAKRQGTLLSGQMYDSGIQAANGVLAGLQARQKEIQAYLVRMAQGMETALKRALGIRSPSRKTWAIATYMGKGIIGGLREQRAGVFSEAQGLAGAALKGMAAQGSTGMLGAPQIGAQRLTPASMGGGATGAPLHLEFKTYNPVAEPQSRTTNKGLDRVASLGLLPS